MMERDCGQWIASWTVYLERCREYGTVVTDIDEGLAHLVSIFPMKWRTLGQLFWKDTAQDALHQPSKARIESVCQCKDDWFLGMSLLNTTSSHTST